MKNKENMVNVYSMEYYSSTKKWNLDICSKVGRTGDHYAKFNKPEIRQISHVLSHVIEAWREKEGRWVSGTEAVRSINLKFPTAEWSNCSSQLDIIFCIKN